jgi:hypothetical protein
VHVPYVTGATGNADLLVFPLFAGTNASLGQRPRSLGNP